MDDTGPQSLFVVVCYGYTAPYFSSIFLLEKNENNCDSAGWFPSEGPPKLKRSSSYPSLSPDTPLNQNLTLEGLRKIARSPLTYSLDPQKDFVAHLTQPHVDPPVYSWKFCTPAISAEELCMVLDSGFPFDPVDVQMRGYILNLSSTNCKQIDPPLGSASAPTSRFYKYPSSRFYKHVVALGGHIYFLTFSYFDMGSLFTRYSPLDESWDRLEPFPDDVNGNGVRGRLLGSVVLDDIIVLNIDDIFWAYNVSTDKWYQVDVPDSDRECYSMLGDAVVLENTIYALTKTSRGIVLALSIEKKGTKVDDLEYSCSLLSEIEVPGMEEDNITSEGLELLTRHLVHLGEDNFCIVECCDSDVYPVDCQPIHVTYMKLKKGEKSMTVTDTFIYKVKILQNVEFYVQLCFSLPNHKTAALRKGSFVHVDPFPEDYASKQDYASKHKEMFPGGLFYREAEEREDTPPHDADADADVVNNNVEGHSVFLRNLPRNADVTEVKKEVEKFGAVKRDGIQVFKSKKGKGGKCAYVEFESEVSKKSAIEASVVKIGGCPAQILERKSSKKKKKTKEVR